VTIYRLVLICLALLFIILLGFPILSLTGIGESKINLNETIDLPFVVDSGKDVVLLYFGYVGCPDVCPASLNEIDNIYKKIDDKYKDRVGVYFVNIIDSGNAQEYVSYFNRDFIGIELPSIVRMKFMNSLHAYKSDPLTNSGDLYHTSYLYLIKSMYYTHPYDVNMVINDIKKPLE